MLGRCFSILSLLALMSLPGNLLAQDALKWTNVDGKEVVGEFIRMEGKTVVIKLDNGKEAKVPLASLSLESHLQALKLSKPEAFNKEVVKAPVIVEAAKMTFKIAPLSVMTSPFEDDPKIDSFMRTFTDEVNRGNLFVMWHMLPPKMQTDLATVISKNLQNLGPTFPTQMKKATTLLASIASKKKDWLIDPAITGRELPPEAITEFNEQWPYVVAFLEGLAEPSVWENPFRPETVPNFLAAVGVNFQCITPAINKSGMQLLSYKVVSESADRAEVELTMIGTPPSVVAFQKVGKVWVSPDLMNQMRKGVDVMLNSPPSTAASLAFGGAMATFLPVLNKLDACKTKEEFKKILDSIPKPQAGATPPGMPPTLPGFPGFSIPGLTPPPPVAPGK
ncbi:MAG: hypothetical protein U0930_15390 [Pirellulales bacterium]